MSNQFKEIKMKIFLKQIKKILKKVKINNNLKKFKATKLKFKK